MIDEPVNHQDLAEKRDHYRRIRQGTFAICQGPDASLRPNDMGEFFRKLRIEGTGFFVRADGVALTALHVLNPWIERWQAYRRGMRARPQMPMPFAVFTAPIQAVGHIQRQRLVTGYILKLRGYTNHDVAACKVMLVPNEKVQPLSLGDAHIWDGDPIALCGYPEGKSLHKDLAGGHVIASSFSEGIVSAVIPFAEAGPRYWRWFQVDALANPGNSGGPAFSPRSGEVEGIVVEGNNRPRKVMAADGTPVTLDDLVGITRAFSAYHAKQLIDAFVSDSPIEEAEIEVDFTTA